MFFDSYVWTFYSVLKNNSHKEETKPSALLKTH